MSKTSWAALWLVLAIASCSRTHESELGDSSTHWLKQCAADAECGGLSCECGLCSKRCSASAACGGFGAGASCEEAAPSCGAATRLCDAMCERDANCPAQAASCVAGRCRALPLPAVGGDGGSASDASDASSGAADATTGGTDAGLAFRCPPQRATNVGECVAENPQFIWNGVACKALTCSCEGEDCAAAYVTRELCEFERAGCSPPSMCESEPWYKCADFCPAHWVLLGGGRSFGECDRGCRFELELLPLIVPDLGHCPDIEGHLRVQNADGSERAYAFGLSPSAWAEAAMLSLALENADLPPVTVCSDEPCPLDVGRGWIDVSRRSARDPEPDEFSYDLGNAPPILRQADQFIQGLIDQVQGCRGPALARCESSGSEDGAPAPVCGGRLAIGPSTCTCPVELAALQGMSCDLQCASCSPPDGMCGARCVQPCAGGEPAWDVICAD